MYGLPIDILDARFSDGTILTGEFVLNPYGYIASGWLTTRDGYGLDGTTPIVGVTFVSSATSAGLARSPTTTPNVLYASAGPYLMTLTFQHDLGTPGANPFLLDAFDPQSPLSSYKQTPVSAECQDYSCHGYGDVDTPGNERLLVSGVAMVPEPAAFALLGGPAFGLLVARRRRL